MSNSTAKVSATKYSMDMVKRVAERMSKKEGVDGLKVCDCSTLSKSSRLMIFFFSIGGILCLVHRPQACGEPGLGLRARDGGGSGR